LTKLGQHLDGLRQAAARRLGAGRKSGALPLQALARFGDAPLDLVYLLAHEAHRRPALLLEHLVLRAQALPRLLDLARDFRRCGADGLRLALEKPGRPGELVIRRSRRGLDQLEALTQGICDAQRLGFGIPEGVAQAAELA